MTLRYPASIDPQHAIMVVVKGDPTPSARIPVIEVDLARFQSGRWALQLDAVFARRRAPAVILAQGVACLAVAWWAQLSPRSYLKSVEGAVFLSPLNIGFAQDAAAAAARSGPTTKLPFASIVASASYPFIDRLLALADAWGSHFVETAVQAPSQPTNRHAVRSDAEARLLALLPLLQGAQVADRPAPDLLRPADVVIR